MDYLKENLIIELQNILAGLMRGALPSVYAYMGSVCIDPLNPLCIGKKNAKGFRTPPSNISESIIQLNR